MDSRLLGCVLSLSTRFEVRYRLVFRGMLARGQGSTKRIVATPRARHFRGVGPRVSGGGEALSQIGAVVGVWHVEAILALFAPPVRLRMLFRPPLQYLVPQAGLGSDVLMLPVQFAGQGRLRRLRMSVPSDPKCPGNSRHRIQTHIQVVIDRFLHTTFF